MNLEAIIKNYVDEAVNEAIEARFAEIESNEEQPQKEEPAMIRGIAGLARFLGVSQPTAQKLKNQGVFPYTQWGRVLLFKQDDVLTGLRKITK